MNIIIVILGLDEKLIGDAEQLDTGDLYIKNPYIIHTTMHEYRQSNLITKESLESTSDAFSLIYNIQESPKDLVIRYINTRFSKFIPESNDEGFVIQIDKVLTLSEPKEELKEKYLQLIA